MKIVKIWVTQDYTGTEEERDEAIVKAFEALDKKWLGVIERNTESLSSVPRYTDVRALVSADYAMDLMTNLRGVNIKIEGIHDLSNVFVRASERQAQFDNSESNWNNKCEVHISGHSLATYNETLLLTDICSDSLQDHIDEGWRILAVCPQPDQRRPDYIMGRFDPARDVKARYHSSGALRWDPKVPQRPVEVTTQTVGVQVSNPFTQSIAEKPATESLYDPEIPF